LHITIFLGSSMGSRPVFQKAAAELGTALGKAGHTLVYGGSRTGLMGVLARNALDAGGTVIGIEPESFIKNQQQLDNLSQLIIVKDMAERKEKLIELGDLLLAFPGGIGTLEEISEALSKKKLGLIKKPLAFLNLEGYYAPLQRQLLSMAREGFAADEWIRQILFLDDVSSVLQFIRKSNSQD
jgi:uncharacterized protein (TIGR00730 family)